MIIYYYRHFIINKHTFTIGTTYIANVFRELFLNFLPFVFVFTKFVFKINVNMTICTQSKRTLALLLLIRKNLIHLKTNRICVHPINKIIYCNGEFKNDVLNIFK